MADDGEGEDPPSPRRVTNAMLAYNRRCHRELVVHLEREVSATQARYFEYLGPRRPDVWSAAATGNEEMNIVHPRNAHPHLQFDQDRFKFPRRGCWPPTETAHLGEDAWPAAAPSHPTTTSLREEDVASAEAAASAAPTGAGADAKRADAKRHIVRQNIAEWMWSDAGPVGKVWTTFHQQGRIQRRGASRAEELRSRYVVNVVDNDPHSVYLSTLVTTTHMLEDTDGNPYERAPPPGTLPEGCNVYLQRRITLLELKSEDQLSTDAVALVTMESQQEAGEMGARVEDLSGETFTYDEVLTAGDLYDAHTAEVGGGMLKLLWLKDYEEGESTKKTISMREEGVIEAALRKALRKAKDRGINNSVTKKAQEVLEELAEEAAQSRQRQEDEEEVRYVINLDNAPPFRSATFGATPPKLRTDQGTRFTDDEGLMWEVITDRNWKLKKAVLYLKPTTWVVQSFARVDAGLLYPENMRSQGSGARDRIRAAAGSNDPANPASWTLDNNWDRRDPDIPPPPGLENADRADMQAWGRETFKSKLLEALATDAIDPPWGWRRQEEPGHARGPLPLRMTTPADLAARVYFPAATVRFLASYNMRHDHPDIAPIIYWEGSPFEPFWEINRQIQDADIDMSKASFADEVWHWVLRISATADLDEADEAFSRRRVAEIEALGFDFAPLEAEAIATLLRRVDEHICGHYLTSVLIDDGDEHRQERLDRLDIEVATANLIGSEWGTAAA